MDGIGAPARCIQYGYGGDSVGKTYTEWRIGDD
jgi:hypothetical protein